MALVAGLAAFLYVATRSPVPQWIFDNKPFLLGVKVPLAWSYEPPSPGKPVRFELESGVMRPSSCRPAPTRITIRRRRQRDARLESACRADCASRAAVSGWSEPISVTQYDSVYASIAATGESNVFVSNSQDQDVFKWGDQGFDITKLFFAISPSAWGRDVKLVLNAVELKRLLPQAGSGVADFAISSITKRAYREQEFPIRFSESYFCTTHALLYRTDSPDRPIREMIAGKSVGAQSDTTNYQLAELLSEGGEFKLEAFANTESLKNALREGSTPPSPRPRTMANWPSYSQQRPASTRRRTATRPGTAVSAIGRGNAAVRSPNAARVRKARIERSVRRTPICTRP